MRISDWSSDVCSSDLFHSDHIGDLGEFNLQTWGAGRPTPLQVYGPEGVARVVTGFQEAYALDAGYRTAHHGADFLPPALEQMQAHTLTLSTDGTPTPARSEEHTSELQSLMRISYAVFCL